LGHVADRPSRRLGSKLVLMVTLEWTHQTDAMPSIDKECIKYTGQETDRLQS
jgi:hypothetical protein